MECEFADLQLLSAALHLHVFICLAALVRLGPWQVLFHRPVVVLLALVVEVSFCVALVPADKLSARWDGTYGTLADGLVVLMFAICSRK